MRVRLGALAGALLVLSPLSLGGLAPAATNQLEEPAPVAEAQPGEAGVFFASSLDAVGGDGTNPPSWVMQEPGQDTQVQKTAHQRGINPCMIPDPGFAAYRKWDRAPSMGQMILPKDMDLGPNGEFDVFFHFHGHDPARKSWVQAMDSAVLVGIDLGVGSGAYLGKFQIKEEFELLVSSVEAGVRERLAVAEARARRIGLSSWSAGYGAVGQILRKPELQQRIDTVVLLDGLHTGYQGNGLEVAKLRPFAAFANLAAQGEKLMFVSHSSIIPPGYASTTETASYLAWKTGGKPVTAQSRSGDSVGLSLVRRYSRGNFHVRGYAGNDTLDHCAHLALYKDVLRTHVAPRWQLHVD